MREAKLNYAAATESRFRRTRYHLGGRADAHYVRPLDWYNLREYARDMDRNDPIVGQLVDRAVDNIVRDGLVLTPQTGDAALDRDLKAMWGAWAEDPLQCDETGTLAFPEMERLVKRSEIVDGDIFALPLDNGRVQLVESEWVDSPLQLGGNVIHGIEINDAGRPLRYWFQIEREGARFTHLSKAPWGNYVKRPALDEDGEPVVLHIYSPTRVSQRRGITAFHAVADLAGMVEDVNFAKLVQQQIVSCAALFIKRTEDFRAGSRSTETWADGNVGTLEEMAPGLVIRGVPGEELQGFSPQVPNAEYFQHIKLLLRILGCNLGMPLTLVLLDTENTTFHGYRGELQQARMGFEVQQRALPRRFHRPIYRWWVRRQMDALPASARRMADDGRLFAHKWQGRGWPYVEPKTDAEADKVRLENLLISPRDLSAERGRDWEEIVAETVEDRTRAIEAARQAAEGLGDDVTWRDVLNLAPSKGGALQAPPAGSAGSAEGTGGEGGEGEPGEAEAPPKGARLAEGALGFDEAKHPRKGGKFAPKGEEEKEETKERKRAEDDDKSKRRKPPAEEPESERARIAKIYHKPMSKVKEGLSTAAEEEVATALGGKRSGDNKPMDILIGDDIGIEVKVVHEGRVSRAEMRRDSRERKEAWLGEQKGRKGFTVVIDNRDVFEDGKHRELFSGNRIYWKEGVGAFRFGTMNVATDLADLKRQLKL